MPRRSAKSKSPIGNAAPLRVFLCHAFGDKPQVRTLYRWLLEHGVKAWLDEEDLLPGQNWEYEIPNAVRKSDVVVVCLSRRSVNKEGYVQKEITIALDVADMKPEGEIFIIPAKLEECELPSRLSRLQWVNLFTEGAYDRLLRSLDARKSTNRVLKRSRQATSSVPARIYRPGGPMPVDATHYVERESDGEVHGALRVPAFRMMVRGPVQCGKSSLLARLEQKAQAQGIETAWFDPWAAVRSAFTSGKQAENVIAITAAKLARTLEIEWGLDPLARGSVESVDDVAGWLIRALVKLRKPRLLIIDDVGTLGVDASAWLSFVRLVDTKTASRDIQISVAIGMTDSYGPYSARMLESFISTVSWEPRVTLRWLTEEQTLELERKLTGKELGLYNLFLGQPYLTHAAATDSHFRELAEGWTKARAQKNQYQIRESLPYKRHLNAIKLALLGPPWQRQFDSRHLVELFVTACQGSRPALTRDHESFLKIANLLNDKAEPMLDIYSIVAEDLSNQANYP